MLKLKISELPFEHGLVLFAAFVVGLLKTCMSKTRLERGLLTRRLRVLFNKRFRISDGMLVFSVTFARHLMKMSELARPLRS